MDTIKCNADPLRELALFAGAGGGILGGQLLGWRTVCAVECEAHARAVLCARQNDGCLEPFPIWDDVRTFDGRPWRSRVDIVSGGFPCQDISCAGKGAGISGDRSGLWSEMARIIGEIRPSYAWIENSPMLTLRGLDRVLCDLASMGYDATWGVVGASDAGAPHRRERVWIMANAMSSGQWRKQRQSEIKGNVMADPDCFQRGPGGVGQDAGSDRRDDFGRGCQVREVSNPTSQRQSGPWQHWFASDPAEVGEGEADYAFAERVGHIWGIKSPLGRVANGVANRVDRLERIGNGQCPQAMALAWKILSGMTDNSTHPNSR